MARDLRLFYLFRLLSTSYLFVPISVMYAQGRGMSLVQIALLHTVYSVAVILTEVPTGALADRLGRRVTMIAGAVAMVAACVAYLLAHGFVSFALATALAALSMTLCSGADSAYLFDLLHEHGRGHEYARREGTASAWHQAGQALAFAAGGVLGGRNLALPYLVTAVVASAAFFVALFMRADAHHHAAHGPLRLTPRRYVEHMTESIRAVTARRRLMWVIGYSAVVFMMLRITEYVYQPYLKASGFTLAETGFVFAAMYLVAAAVAHNFDALRRWLAEPTLLWGLLITLVVTFLLLGVTQGPAALVVMGVQAVANGLYSPLVKLLLQREISDSRRRATVLSVESMLRRVASGSFSPAVGGLMEAYGPAAGLTLCGAAGFAGLVALASTFRAGRQRVHQIPIPPSPIATPAPRTADLTGPEI
jgi:predicted MFS family arabinose efflux permease